jgi:ABC-type lipoprotein export system ATPase subunit
LITHEPAVAASAERTIHVRDGRIFADEVPGRPEPGRESG